MFLSLCFCVCFCMLAGESTKTKFTKLLKRGGKLDEIQVSKFYCDRSKECNTVLEKECEDVVETKCQVTIHIFLNSHLFLIHNSF